jgi:hypothetical protein
MDNFDLRKYLVENKLTTDTKMLNEEPLNALDFTEILASSMQKNMPKDRWTVKFEDGEIVVENDFNEIARYRPVYYRNSSGEERF